jgi:hypothetical protein
LRDIWTVPIHCEKCDYIVGYSTDSVGSRVEAFWATTMSNQDFAQFLSENIYIWERYGVGLPDGPDIQAPVCPMCGSEVEME